MKKKLGYRCKCGRIIYNIPKDIKPTDKKSLYFSQRLSPKIYIWKVSSNNYEGEQLLHKACYNKLWTDYILGDLGVIEFFKQKVKYENNKKTKQISNIQ